MFDQLSSWINISSIVTIIAVAFGVIYDWLATSVFGPGFSGSIWFNPLFIIGEGWIIFTGIYIYVGTLDDPKTAKWPINWWFCLVAFAFVLICLPLDAVVVIISAVVPFLLTFVLYSFSTFSGPFNITMTLLVYFMTCFMFALMMFARFPNQRLPWWKTLLFPFQGIIQLHISQLKYHQKAVHHEHYHWHLQHLGSTENVFGYHDEDDSER